LCPDCFNLIAIKSFKNQKMKKLNILLLAFVMLLTATGLNAQTVVSVTASKDNVIYYNNGSTTKSNGVGPSLVAGNTNTANYWRRSLIKFDLPSLCTGAIIDSVTVRLYAVKVAQGDTAHRSFSLYRLTSDWGEGTSDAADTTGKGAPATTGDATWSYKFYSSSLWTTAGGDYSSTLSATTGLLPYTSFVTKYVYFRSSTYSQLKTDVQAWMASPSINNGWILKGIEGTLRKSAEFRSKDYSVDSLKPTLFIYYTCPDEEESLLQSVQVAETSLSVEKETVALSVYPNPVLTEAGISLSSGEVAQVTLYNKMGTAIKAVEVRTWPLSVNMSGLEKGIYVVKAVTPKGSTYSQTFIKE
jgi:hypothetical protein